MLPEWQINETQEDFFYSSFCFSLFFPPLQMLVPFLTCPFTRICHLKDDSI